MDTIFAVPMRQNNDNLLDSGHQLLADWVAAVSNIQQINVRFDILSMDAGSEIIVSHYLYNGPTEVKHGVTVWQDDNVPKKVSIGFSRGDMDDNTAINCTIRTVGRARFSIDVISFDIGEDVPEWDTELPW